MPLFYAITDPRFLSFQPISGLSLCSAPCSQHQNLLPTWLFYSSQPQWDEEDDSGSQLVLTLAFVLPAGEVRATFLPNTIQVGVEKGEGAWEMLWESALCRIDTYLLHFSAAAFSYFSQRSGGRTGGRETEG